MLFRSRRRDRFRQLVGAQAPGSAGQLRFGVGLRRQLGVSVQFGRRVGHRRRRWLDGRLRRDLCSRSDLEHERDAGVRDGRRGDGRGLSRCFGLRVGLRFCCRLEYCLRLRGRFGLGLRLGLLGLRLGRRLGFDVEPEDDDFDESTKPRAQVRPLASKLPDFDELLKPKGDD